MIGGGGGGPGQAIGAAMAAVGNAIAQLVQQEMGVAQQGNLVRRNCLILFAPSDLILRSIRKSIQMPLCTLFAVRQYFTTLVC